MDPTRIEQLKKISLFSGIPEQGLNSLAEKVSTRRLGRDEVLFRKGDQGDALYMIEDGWVKIITEDNEGKELVLNRCGPGESIGEMSLLDDEPRSAGVVALSDGARLMELKREAFLDVLDENPEVAMFIIRSTSSRLRFATTYIEKAIEWSHRIAVGDYSFAMQQIETSQQSGGETNEAKAGQLLSAFFELVQGVRAREEELKEQLQRLTFEIDEARRKQEFEELTNTDFYAQLKSQAAEMRQKRKQRGS